MNVLQKAVGMGEKQVSIIVAPPSAREVARALEHDLTHAGYRSSAPDLSELWRAGDWYGVASGFPADQFIVFLIAPDAQRDQTFTRLLWQAVPLKEDPTGKFIFVVLDRTAAANEHIAPFLKRHFSVDDIASVRAIAAHIDGHAELLKTHSSAQPQLDEDAEPTFAFGAGPGPIQWLLMLTLGLFGAGFWFDAAGNYFHLTSTFEGLLRAWRDSVGTQLRDLLWWLPHYFGLQPPPWAYNYFPITALFWIGLAILIVPDLFRLLSTGSGPPAFELPLRISDRVMYFLSVPIALIVMLAIWPIFSLFLPTAVLHLLQGRVRRADAMFLLLFSPFLFAATILILNAVFLVAMRFTNTTPL